jgi:hypothetical protein
MEKETMEYHIAFVLESTGEFEIVDTFGAYDDDGANDYAEENYPNQEWWVLNAAHINING